MSLYNLVQGFNVNAGLCLAMLGLDQHVIPRFRDAWLSDDGTKITILTRTGGGNRSDYETENCLMTQVAGYDHDEDDDFDPTFAHFLYSVPERFRDSTKIIAELMVFVGKAAINQGPGAIMKKVDRMGQPPAPEAPKIDTNDPRVVAAGEAYKSIISIIQKDAREKSDARRQQEFAEDDGA